MRWVLTWKLDEAPEPGSTPLKRDSSGNPMKPKARAVILGYMDPKYEFRPTSSPIMSRTSRQLFLQLSANYGFRVEKGDISGAFLQGDNFGPERPMYCEPLPEILEALDMPPESTMPLTRTAYGLVEATLQWYLTIANFLESIGGERQFSDPCVWGFFDEQRKPIAWASGHVDEFMFSGNPKNPKWIQERFQRGSCETDKLVQCGVLIESLPNHGFHLSQPDYLDSLQEIQINRSRWKDLEAQITSHELQQLRSILGGLSWHASQVAPQLSAAVSLLLSKLHQGTVQTMVETNRLLPFAKG